MYEPQEIHDGKAQRSWWQVVGDLVSSIKGSYDRSREEDDRDVALLRWKVENWDSTVSGNLAVRMVEANLWQAMYHAITAYEKHYKTWTPPTPTQRH